MSEVNNKRPMNPIPIFHNKHILLGVTGSIAAYKAVDLASRLTQAGATVTTLLTEAAARFVTPLTFRSVTGQRALTDLWGEEAHVVHVDLAEHAQLFIIAPATANTIAKLAHGVADNLLTVTALAARCPIVLAPAMDGGLYSNPATQTNLKALVERGFTIVGPASGRMASGLVGKGRLVEPLEIFGQARLRLARSGPLTGRHIVVTAGGTQEPLDPVRFITNRSSGKQGFALAQAALDHGAQVTLITGPTVSNALATPTGARRIDVNTAAEMAEAVLRACSEADALVMAAAVADFRPAHVAQQKIKKANPPHIELEKTVDILGAVAERRETTRRPEVVVGFAAESQNLVENAREKIQRKKLTFIVANDISATDAGFSVDTNRVTLVDADEGVEQLPLLPKTQVAEAVMDRVTKLLKAGHGH
jgi:phosphopantothenoylcysteine decarboxylase/phosphopantothenate--cysteine ligase